MKAYDRAYFDRWYRHPATRLRTAGDVGRKVRMVVGMAEHVLERPARSVLDVGCGEAVWQPVLARLRPGLRYTGIDPSDYAVRRFGRRRHVRRGAFGALDRARLADRYDVIVVCDVLHYLPLADIRRGLAELAPRLEGVAFLEAYTAADEIDGDTVGFRRRSPATWRRLMREAGLLPIGLQCYVGEELRGALTALELPSGA